MQCQRCGERPAVVHQTVVVNDQKQENYLCEVCARQIGQQLNSQLGHQMGGYAQGGFSFPNLNINQLLASFLGQGAMGGAPGPRTTRRQAEPKCSHCGLTYSQFAETGRLGCSHCYTELEQHLLPLIKRIHGTTDHHGKAPKRTGGIVRKKRELSALQHQLQAAVVEEHFEEAARLRDRIKEMQRQIEAGGEDSGVE